jgi:ribonuclease HI
MIAYCDPKESYRSYELKLSRFNNPETLNIFTDASRRSDMCESYGVIIIYNGEVIHKDIRESSNRSINCLELLAIRLALDYSMYYRNQYPFINIFSDSLYSVNTLIRGLYKWKYHPKEHLYYNERNEKPVPNQELILEIFDTLLNLSINHVHSLNLFYTPAHVVINSELKEARYKFLKHNRFNTNSKVDIGFMRYVCQYNSYIDNEVQKSSKRSTYTSYVSPISFIPSDHYKNIVQ